MKITDLFDMEFLQRMEAEGFVRRQAHPVLPLAILNYTPKAQYSREWNGVTTLCRGLIYNTATGDLVARPFAKFFNLGELTDEEIPAEPFRVFDKMDGSLGVLYPLGNGELAISTRGSFTSEQAKWATGWLTLFRGDFVPMPQATYLFEIIYPENRIVVDYGGRSDLVLLDVIDNETGGSLLDEERGRKAWRNPFGNTRWNGSFVQEFDGFDVLDTLHAADQPDNSEGYVIRFESGMRAKLKHDEYVRLHRIVTGVSTKTIWEHLSQHQSLDELLDRVPDEFFDWVKRTRDDLEAQYDEVLTGAKVGLHATRMRLGEGYSRKDLALAIQDHPYRSIIFMIEDGRDPSKAIWQRIKPVYEKPFAAVSEDTA